MYITVSNLIFKNVPWFRSTTERTMGDKHPAKYKQLSAIYSITTCTLLVQHTPTYIHVDVL